MKSFFDFIIENKELIISILTFIVGVIAILVKRKPKTIDDFKLACAEALDLIPELVIKVEVPSKGAEKKLKVISMVKSLVCKSLGRCLTSSEESYITEEASKKIEVALSTPTKKIC